MTFNELNSLSSELNPNREILPISVRLHVGNLTTLNAPILLRRRL